MSATEQATPKDTTNYPTTAARAAAEWWARQVEHPTFRMTSVEEDRVDPAGIFGAGLAHIAANRHPVTPEQLAAFADALEATIQRRAGEDDGLYVNGLYSLHVDYHPDRDLVDAAESVGINTSRFPLKSHMWLRKDGSVTARLGYGAEERLVWAPPGWDRPGCDRMRREPVPDSAYMYDFRYFPEVCGRPKYHEDDCGDWLPDPVRCDLCGSPAADHYNAHLDDVKFGHSMATAADR